MTTDRARRPLFIAIAATALSCLLLFAGCNASGLPQIPTPTPLPALSPTSVSQVLPATSTSAPAVTELPTSAPRATNTAAPTLAPTRGSAKTSTPAPTKRPASPTDAPTLAANPTATRAGEPTEEPGTVTPSPTEPTQAERVSIFEQVWSTVDKNYLYPDFHGADWQALHDKYLPIITNATNSHDYYTAISDMVAELKDDHSRYLSPQDAREEDSLQGGNADYVGIGVLSSPETSTLNIIFVFPGSPAEKAGIQRRDKIIAVDGEPITDPTVDQTRIRGPAGSTVTLTVRSPEQAPRDVPIVRGAITGGIVPTGSRLTTDKTIGLLVIPDLWTDDMGTLVQDDLQKMTSDSTPLNGLILDLRGNGGGFRTVLQTILGDFVSGQVGQFSNQNGHTPFMINKTNLYNRLKNVPLAVLIDKGSESYTEVLAGVLQDEGRAKIVGVTSAGNTETIYSYNFDDGSRLWVAEESFQLPNGTNLEGRGVIPDVSVSQDWTQFTEKDDPDILAAVQLIRNK